MPKKSAPTKQPTVDDVIAEAKKLAAEDVLPFKADAALALHNVQVGVKAVQPFEARIAAELPAVDFAQIVTLPDLAQAVVGAALDVHRDQPAASTIDDLLARAYPVRKKLLSAARALADAEVLKEADVRAIEVGRGRIDAANDCVQLEKLFRANADAVKGKSAVTEADLVEAKTVGEQLQLLLHPKRASHDRPTPEAVAAAADLRDRLWTLLVQRYDRLWRVGAWLFGHQVDEKVPPLQSRVAAPR